MASLVKEFEISVTDGTLNLAFIKVVNNPKISAIEVVSLTNSNFRIDSSASDTAIPDSLNMLATPETMSPTEGGSVVNTYPNPFEDVINIRFEAEEPQDYTVSVYDVAGQVHFQGAFTSGSTERSIYQIDLTNQSLATGGVYLVFIESNNGKFLKVFKMVKK